MQKLPIGIQSFEKIREGNYLYVDKTEKILQLIEKGECYFLSRPRRFGKSLTLSTLESMFKGKVELFKGLYAEEWVKEQAKKTNPVIKLDMSGLGNYTNISELSSALIDYLGEIIDDYNLNIQLKENAGRIFAKIIKELYKKFGKVVLLIDEYDKPITDNINDLEKANEIREFFRKFYGILKNSSTIDNLHFIFITGVSKFSKAGIFSGLNNLSDISMNKKYSDIVGYTQKELEDNFGDWIEKTGQEMSFSKEELLEKIKRYYDGFSFDGKVRVYNPFSVLNFFDEQKFNNYWYISGTPSFLVDYFKQHQIDDIDKLRHIKVASNFADEQEIEKATPESFLFQAGYLTIEKWDSRGDSEILTLDYPNEEVKKSISQLFLRNIYKIERYISLGDNLWDAIIIKIKENNGFLEK